MKEEWVVHGVAVRVASELSDAAGELSGAAGERTGTDAWDALVLVTAPGLAPPRAFAAALEAAARTDAALHECVSVLREPRAAGGRLVVSPTGPLTAYDDVRSVAEAARAGVERALRAGARRPALVLQPHARWPRAPLVALLAALEALYVPLQVRETFPDNALLKRKPAALGVLGEQLGEPLAELLREAVALEIARGVARDIGGADPERMTPRRCAEFVRGALAGGAVRVRVLEDADEIARQYPLFAAVDRAAASVPRHKGCIIYLEYVPDEYEETVMLVGKGVTYDTGGCDIKAGGAMAGMSRDKCGAAAVVGFLKACELLRPRLKVCASLAMVRNSVGEEAYVADELLRSRRGRAVRVGNTDAEGRLAMADLLHEMAERAGAERRAHVYSVATLTGHAARAFGACTAALDNHAAAAAGHAPRLRAAAALLGDMIEVSTIRREDLAAHRGRGAGDDLHQADNCASTAAPRGHQAPAAFLLLASGLDAGAVPYSHLDVAGSAGAPPAQPSAAPLLALAAAHRLVRTGL